VIFEWERSINGLPPAQRLAVREKEIAPIVEAFEVWMRAERARLSRHAEVAKAMDYMLKRWTAFTRFCLSNNAAERALRGKSWLFAGSERGGERAAIMYSLIQTAMLNGVDPQAWLADVLNRIADHPITELPAMLPWSWKKPARSCCTPPQPPDPRRSPDGSENRIFYPFHPRCGETVAIVRTHCFQGADVFVVQQPDGTLAHIPRWMMEETAARHSLGSQPRLSLNHLRNFRLEIDALLNFLQLDSNAEEVVDEARKAASGSLRKRQRTGAEICATAAGKCR
jgi:hypothetical protein